MFIVFNDLFRFGLNIVYRFSVKVSFATVIANGGFSVAVVHCAATCPTAKSKQKENR